MSNELIDRLSRDLRPAGKGMVMGRLTLGLAIGAGVALAGMGVVLGFRSDMAQAVSSRMFWMKLTYALALAFVGLWCVERLARPGAGASRRMPWIAAPALGIGLMAVLQLMRSAPSTWRALAMGDSAMVCPWRILVTALPVFVALIWALRGLAPTRTRLAGAMAGLVSGGVGAAVYALHCPEVGAPFVAIWYSLGILAPCVIGALAGPRLLRW